jgi:ribosomal protein L11 methylase PrmA
MTWSRDRGSFRDPSGFVFVQGGVAYRQVNDAFSEPYRRLMGSGLYDELSRGGLLVPHEEVPLRLPDAPAAFAVLRPAQVPFISYPYEWCFSQLKAAALLTLDIQRRAIERGLVLRDASAYNVQFIGSRPVFIDTLSFGPYAEGQPWVAYRQFCQHFLAPLALMAHVDPSLGDLAALHIDGVPMTLAASMLPFKTRLKPGLLMHLHLHSRSEARTAAPPDSNGSAPAGNGHARPRHAKAMGRTAMLGLIDSLDRTVRQLSVKPARTLWSTYGTHLNYSEAAQQRKREIVTRMLDIAHSVRPLRVIWDLGANTGTYSHIAAETGARVISFDGDHAVVEGLFCDARRQDDDSILPLVQNLANPSPAVGWNHGERRSLVERGPADAAMALALVHHLAIGCNVPLDAIAEFLSRICRHLIIEFVPREDTQVRRMLALREDVFAAYTRESFERAFGVHFRLVDAVPIEGTVRTMYLMERPR